jgi:SAM-dependent methyltransferase
MGLIYTHAAMLAKARLEGACFDNTLTLGHLWSYLTEPQFAELARRCGREDTVPAGVPDQYADRFIQSVLGARRVSSLDYSDFEHCDIVHDMNQPVPADLHEQFDAIIDGGSIEHIFHFPTAIANCMKMVKPGGSIFIFTAANNCLGHGFYQFSPELFFRVFDASNGFGIRDIILEQHPFPGAELSTSPEMYAVADPAAMHERVGLVSGSPVQILVHAVRHEVKEIFGDYPIQSDYASRYEGGVDATSEPSTSLAQRMARLMPLSKRLVPLALRVYIRGRYQLKDYSFSNQRFYKRWSPF